MNHIVSCIEEGRVLGSVRITRGTITAAILAIFLASNLVGQSCSISFQSVSSMVTGGEISQNADWVLAESPYVVTEDVIVTGGVVLTIDAGVVVKFDGNFSLTVYGSIHAVGTSSDPVVFTSNKPLPAPGDWNTVEFAGALDQSCQFSNVIVEYARSGVTVRSLGSAAIENSRISDCLAHGIYVQGNANLTVRDSVMERNENGIASNGQKVSGISVVGNSFNNNGRGTYFQAYAPENALIYGITVLNNTFEFNHDGLFFYIFAGSEQNLDTSVIRDVLIEGNTASFNVGYGIHLYSGGPWLGSIFNVSITNNRVAFNRDGVYLLAKAHSISTVYDVTLSNNIVSENTDKGVYVSGGVSRLVEEGIKTNITGNSVSYNGYGVFYDGDTGNVAHYNDIYNNAYGMYVNDQATVDAEYNFWGASTGPFHPLLLPSGEGNVVNGNGTDLDFVPFLSAATANRNPVALLEADRTMVSINESIMFNASRSFDDGRIREFLYDFGDGTNSGWVSSPIVVHTYSHVGAFIASLFVVDDLGSESLRSSFLIVHIQLTLFVTLSFSSDKIGSNQNLTVTVLVTDGVNAVTEAYVGLDSDQGGVFSPQVGLTNSSGFFASVFNAPSVEQQMFATIVANASKGGYWSGQSQKQVAVLVPSAPINMTRVLLILASAILIAVVILVALKKRKFR